MSTEQKSQLSSIHDDVDEEREDVEMMKNEKSCCQNARVSRTRLTTTTTKIDPPSVEVG